MGKNPAFQLYPSDWTRDLEEHPLEIEGAWIRICCKLWWEPTKGTATKTLLQWARILGTHHSKARVILNYLGKNRIGNVEYLDNQNITITSRRMVRDEEIRQIRRTVGKLGGNPALKTKSENLVNQNPTPSSSSSSSYSKINKRPTPPLVDNSKKQKHLESVFLSQAEYKKLQEAIGQKSLDLGIEKLNYSISVKGGKYKNHYICLLSWHRRGYLAEKGNGDRASPPQTPYKICAHCGGEHLQGETVRHNGKEICPKCPENKAIAAEAHNRLSGLVGAVCKGVGT